MELEYKTIKLVKIGPDFCLDTLYANSEYDDPFVIETIHGELCTVSLTWEQGRGNNYRLVKGDVFSYSDRDIIWPNQVAMIEVRE